MRRRGRRGRFTTFTAGLIGIILILAICYGAYTKFANPFASKYTAHLIVSNANGLRPDSLVRVAGVNVGKVESVGAYSGCKTGGKTQQQCSASEVTLNISDMGLPIHKDATFAIRPRIFLEGNFFVDVNAGTPEAPVAPNGYVFPVQQTVEPVQFDQLLGSLQSDTRHNLQLLLQQYGIAVKQGGPAYNSSIQYWLPAYEWGAAVSHDTLGTEPHDLSKWIDKAGVANGALDQHPQNLKNLVTDLNTTAGAFARENVALENAVAELPRTLSVAIPAFNALNNAFPPLRRFARALIPGVVSTGPMVDASLPFFHQLRLLVQPSELRGLVHDLSFTVPALARLNAATVPLQHAVRSAASCVVGNIYPWSQLTIHDQHFNENNGFPPRKVYVEGVDFLPGLAGESRTYDANGPYVRILGTGGTLTYSLQPGLFGQALNSIDGVQPQLPPEHSSPDHPQVPVFRPPLLPNVPCETQPAISQTNLNDAPTGTGPQQIHASLDAPGAMARSKAADQIAIAIAQKEAKDQGYGFKLSGKAPGK